MPIQFNPWKEHGLENETVRLVIKDFEEKTFYRLEVIHQGDAPFILNDSFVEQNRWRFKYKYQIKQEKWTDVTPYMELISQEEKLEFERTILDQITLDEEEIPGWIKRWDVQADVAHKVMGRAVYRFMRQLWTNPNFKPRNVPMLVQYIEGQGYSASLLGNVLFYFSIYLELKGIFNQHGLDQLTYGELLDQWAAQPEHADMIRQLIHKCEAYASTLQLANVLCGKLESLLGNRTQAAQHFKAASSFETDYLKYLDFDQGSLTYTDLPEPTTEKQKRPKLLDIFKRNKETPQRHTLSENAITYVGPGPNADKSQFIILISLDERFLRSYGPQLMFYAAILKEYPFHIHVVGEESEVIPAIDETIKLFDMIGDYRGEKGLIQPGFSYEPLPDWVQDKRTYYACARFIHGEKIMNDYQTSLFIMDADLIFLHDPKDFFSWMQQYDLALPLSSGIVTVSPWRRVLAGNLFIKNNGIGRHFLFLTKKYILQHLDQTRAWTLDQNALCYAFENIRINRELSLGNCYAFDKPMTQGSIHKSIELK